MAARGVHEAAKTETWLTTRGPCPSMERKGFIVEIKERDDWRLNFQISRAGNIGILRCENGSTISIV
jgi:hypothetical protein